MLHLSISLNPVGVPPCAIQAARAALEALDRGWKLNWDAANPISLRLACKIGFEPDGEYEAVLVK